MIVDRRLLAQFDWMLFASCLTIPLLGLVVLYSAGYDPDSPAMVLAWLPIKIQSAAFAKQLLFIAAGLIVLLITLAIPPSVMARWAYPVYVMCVVLLAAVLLGGVESHGARRWFALGGLRFQPAELMKLSLILAMARYLSRNLPPPGGYGFKGLIAPFALFGVPMALIIRQPDLGTALCVGAVGFGMVLFMGIRIRALMIMVLVVAGGALPAWKFLEPYQQRRVLALINPDADPLGSGYHIIQSKIAVGSGALLGKGFLKGTQSQLEFLPEHTTDFAFSVLAEEWGFAGALVLLLLYFYFLYRLLTAAGRSKELFSALVVFGVTVLIFFHVVVNVGMVVGVLPVVGIPLLLVSYGGSSVMVTMFLVGLVLGINMRRLVFSARS